MTSNIGDFSLKIVETCKRLVDFGHSREAQKLESMQENKPLLPKEIIKANVEALLFVNEKPIDVNEVSRIIGVSKSDLELLADELSGEYSQRKSGLCIVKVAGGYQMCTSPDCEEVVKKFYQQKRKQKLSMAALETLAIVAYKQPITKAEIESIRGVAIDGVVKSLFELGLIKIGGRKEVIGRPFFYITTRTFLEYFGLNSIRDLPRLEEFAALASEQGAIMENQGDDITNGIVACEVGQEQKVEKGNGEVVLDNTQGETKTIGTYDKEEV